MADTTDVARSTDDPGTAQPTRPSRLNQALAWVGIVAGGLFVVGGDFLLRLLLELERAHAHGNGPCGDGPRIEGLLRRHEAG